jgi:hypothetical protein
MLGHTKPSTPMQMDNKTAIGMVNNNVTKKLKTVDMNYLLMLGGREVKQQ